MAVSLQGDDALTLVDILDQVSMSMAIGATSLIPAQVFEAPDMEINLRILSVRILRRVCGSQIILPRSCILSDISKEDDLAVASGGLADVWIGCHNGNRVCVKTFRVCTAENLSRVKQVRSKRLYV